MLDTKKKKIFVTAFIVLCAFFLSAIFFYSLAKSWVDQEEKNDWTECEKMCYPSAVDEEIPNKKCICLPEILTRD